MVDAGGSEADRVAAALEDHEAFSALFEEHVGSVRAVVRKNVRDPDDLADCVQEVWLRALQDLPKLREPDRFRAWLLQIARHAHHQSRCAQHPRLQHFEW